MFNHTRRSRKRAATQSPSGRRARGRAAAESARDSYSSSRFELWRVRAPRCFGSPKTAFGSGELHLLVEDQCSLFVSLAATLDPFGEGTEMRCVLHACVSFVLSGTLARRKKAILGNLAIIIDVRHDTPHPPNITKRLKAQITKDCSEQFYTGATRLSDLA